MQKDLSAKNLIDLNAVLYNVKTIKKLLKQSMFCAVVKSDAYGHGICEIATAINNYCDFFAVSSVEEGAKLRISGIKKPILCLLPTNDFKRAYFYDITVTVQSVNQAQSLENYCLNAGVKINFHLAINTGMNRLGINTICELERIFLICKGGGAIFSGAYSHFYNAKNHRITETQFKKFLIFKKRIKQKYANAICHISSSGGLCKSDKYNLDMVRVGLLIYGYKPVNANFLLKKAMQTVAPCVCERVVLRGENLLYGSYKNKKKRKVSVVPYGYGNGLRRGLCGQLNASCMNLSAVKNFNGVIMSDASVTAKKNRTVVYDVLTAFGRGLKRYYYYGEQNENNSGKI